MHKLPPHKQADPEDLRNLLVAVGLIFLIFLLYDVFYHKPKMERLQKQQEAAEQLKKEQAPEEGVREVVEAAAETAEPRPRAEVLAETARIPIDTLRLKGSVSLTGGRIDDLVLKGYYETTEKDKPVELFSPVGSEYPYYAEFGWLADKSALAVPDKNTVWQLAPDARAATGSLPVLFWDNGQGLRFEREISVDDNYLITVRQRVRNTGAGDVTLYPFSLVSRHGVHREGAVLFLVHEGYLGYFNDDLYEPDYEDLKKSGQMEIKDTGGWAGFTDKYWHVSLIPEQDQPVTARFSYTGVGDQDRYQVDLRQDAQVLSPGGVVENTVYLFAGAKELGLLQKYEEMHKIPHFDLAIDFGVWYIITKPFFKILHFLTGVFGSFAIGLLVFTVIIKTLLFPMARKIFTAMHKLRDDMEKVRPQLLELQKKYAHDRERLQKEIMAVYQRYDVNPVAGCQSVIWPMFIQGIIGFCLYKMLYISIEARHAPFWGWVRDMSEPDPTSIMNLFGLLPWDAPGLFHVGAWPAIMGLTLFLLQSQSPPPADPMAARQANTIKYVMPVIFAWMMAKLPVGGVIYFSWSNTLTILQQHYIKKRMGIETRLLPGMKVHHRKEKKADGDDTEKNTKD